MVSVQFEDIQAAARNIAGGIYDSPCPSSEQLSAVAGCEVFCKLDYLQRTGSFKERGALNALKLLSGEQKHKGVIAASAGNHALGLSYHGQRLGVPVTVVMPNFAPLMKVANCKRLGAEVVQFGDDFDSARKHAVELSRQRGLTYVHGFDDPAIIAGQGTMGLEILEQVPDLDAIVVPIGGGGLIAGVSLAVKTLRPKMKVFGVEPARAASFQAAIRAGTPVDFPVAFTIADGLAVSQVGANAFEIARKHVDKVVSVDEQAITLAVLRLVELEKSVVEGAGAVPLAACMAGLLPELMGKRVALPLTGGNIDTSVLGAIMARGLVADGRLHQFAAQISDRPGGPCILRQSSVPKGPA
ncbi:MAG: threonine/serine dehydratase [Planctomycetota bacterium]